MSSNRPATWEEKGKEKEEIGSTVSSGSSSSIDAEKESFVALAPTLGMTPLKLFYQAEFNADQDTASGRSNLLSDKDLANLAQTSKEAYGFFAPILKQRKVEKLLRHIVSGLTKDVIAIKKMLQADPALLRGVGNVTNRANVLLKRQTPYECALGEGDDELAAIIAEYYKLIPDGKKLKAESDERYAPHINKMAEDFKSKTPAYDLRPLIDIIKQSSFDDVQAALKHQMIPGNMLHDAILAFREAVKPPKEIVVGMHYKHYSTLQQALNLLFCDEWESLSNNCTNDDKCNLVWRQIIGYLQLGLPAIDRIAFARAFHDENRTIEFNHGCGSFRNTSIGSLGQAGSDIAIYGGYAILANGGWDPYAGGFVQGQFGRFMSSKNFKLAELMRAYTVLILPSI